MTTGTAIVAAALALWGGCDDQRPSGSQTPPDPGPPVVYVSPTGDDALPGSAAAILPDRSDGPVRTLQRAQALARGLGPGTAVLLRGGTYVLSQTFALGPADSGTQTAPTRYAAYPGETPILVGGKIITGFRQQTGSPIYKADLSGDHDLRSAHFDQLFWNGQRQTLARYPNLDPQRYSAGFLQVADSSGLDPTRQFHAAPGTLKAWQDPTTAIVSLFSGASQRNDWLQVQAVDVQSGTVTLDGSTGADPTRAVQLAQGVPATAPIAAGDRYFFQNVFEELDAPGEWFFDQNSAALYFWPPGDLAQGPVVVPTLRSVVEIAAQQGAQPPRWIVLDGLTIDGGTATGVTISGAQDCVVQRSTIRNVGGAGVVLSGGLRGSAVGNDIYATGAGAIAVSGGDPVTLFPAHHRASNNYVHHTGALLKGTPAIAVTGVGNGADHNLIHDAPWAGILIGGNDHVIEYNRVRQVDLETQGAGCVYLAARDWAQRGEVLRYNFVSDCGGLTLRDGAAVYPDGAYGIALDDFTSGVLLFGNVVARTALAAVYVHGGRDNRLENNIFSQGAAEQVRLEAWDLTTAAAQALLAQMWATLELRLMAGPLYEQRYPALQDITDQQAGGEMAGSQLLRDIVSYDNPAGFAYYVSGLAEAGTQIDGNVLYCASGDVAISVAGTAQKLDQWRGQGYDLLSVAQDPLLRDPDQDDYRLEADSPATGLGFVDLAPGPIGPQQSLPRATWPITEAPGAREEPPR